MSKVFHFKSVLPRLMVVLMSAVLFSCSGDDDEKLDDGSSNTTDVAVTGNLSKLGITYAHIDGYVNLNLITSTYTSQQVGIELSMTEEFVNPRRAISKELEGNKLTVVIDTLSGHTTYYYRAFVKVNDFRYYGEKRSFTTKDFSNIIMTGSAFNLSFSSATIKCSGDASSIDKENNYAIGVAYSTSKTRLHPDSASAYIDYDPLSGCYYTKSFNVVECPIDSIIKNKSFEKTISFLQTGTTYYYCSFTRAGKKYKLGEVKSFTTKFSDPYNVQGHWFGDLDMWVDNEKAFGSEIEFIPSGLDYTYGNGVEVDYYYRGSVTHNFKYEIRNATIYMQFDDPNLDCLIRDYTIGDDYFLGYIARDNQSHFTLYNYDRFWDQYGYGGYGGHY